MDKLRAELPPPLLPEWLCPPNRWPSLGAISRMITSFIMQGLIDYLQPVQSTKGITCDDAAVGTHGGYAVDRRIDLQA